MSLIFDVCIRSTDGVIILPHGIHKEINLSKPKELCHIYEPRHY